LLFIDINGIKEIQFLIIFNSRLIKYRNALRTGAAFEVEILSLSAITEAQNFRGMSARPWALHHYPKKCIILRNFEFGCITQS